MDESVATACWICGDFADSAEHRIKKSDVIRAYGSGAYCGSKAPVHIFGDTQRQVRSAKAEVLKYGKILCSRCNNQRSQPWDNAYDTFIEWILGNEDQVLLRRFIDFHEVYGDRFSADQLSLLRYFVKSFGCRLVDKKVGVPGDLVALLKEDIASTALKISFSVNERVLGLPKQSRKGFFPKGDLWEWPAEEGRPSGLSWAESNSWFTVHYWYSVDYDLRFGSPWIADMQYVCLGSDGGNDEG